MTPETESNGESPNTLAHDCLIAFGSNQGDSGQIFEQAIKLIDNQSSIEVTAQSKPVTTQPVGGPADQNPYLNGAIRIRTSLSAEQLHRRLVEIESGLGRVRRERWGARAVDLDLLLYDQETVLTPKLTVPHARMSFRRFVLEPANEIASEMLHPNSGCSIGELLNHLDQTDNLIVCVCPNLKTAEIGEELQKKLSESLGNHSEFDSQWDFVLVRDLNELERFSEFNCNSLTKRTEKALDSRRVPKLVCCFLPQTSSGDQTNEDLFAAARAFVGPTLELTVDQGQALIEIKAAIQGMKAI